ncbi:MAG: galactokinase [Spirochaetia bacterium]|nr:galactokinase [Spirochaetia bacterium]
MATKEMIREGLLHETYPHLYAKRYDNNEMDARYASLLESHAKLFKIQEALLFSTAGRSELGGNHTDHNLGKVLAATINLDTIAAVSPRDDDKVVLISEGYPPVEIDLASLEMVESEKNTTEALLRGIAFAFKQKGIAIGGWQANTTSRVLKGSGLSSSAAIEVLCATIFNHLFNGDKLSPIELAIIGQFSENHYFGKPSGLMDQVACANGGIVSIDFKEAKNPVVTPVPFSFEQHGYHLVIVDTGGNHADLTPEYASVPKEMRQVARYFNKMNLREVETDAFVAALPQLRKDLHNDRALLRAIHFFGENDRVSDMLSALKREDMQTYLLKVRSSGESSFCFLQNLYPSSYPQEQGLSLGIAMTKEVLGDSATVRVHGGGFAGTIQAYVPTDKLAVFSTYLESVFGKGSVTVIAVRERESCCIAE